MLLRIIASALLLSAALFIGAASAVEPPEDSGITSAMDCIKLNKSVQPYLPTEVTNTCGTPVAFNNWFCGTEESPCNSYQNRRWSEVSGEFEERGGIYILCPLGDASWQEQGYNCVPVHRIWRTGKYAYGACHLSQSRLTNWRQTKDSGREQQEWIVGDQFYWNDACERWLAKRGREIAKTKESPVEEEYYFDLSPPSLMSF